MPHVKSSEKSVFRKSSGSLLAVGVVLLTAAILFLGGVSVKYDEKGLDVRAGFAYGTDISWDEIENVALLDAFDPGRRLYGYAGWRVSGGDFNNDDYGDYGFYAYTGVPLYIDVTAGGRHTVFNQVTKQETKALFDEISDRANGQK